VRTEGRQSRLPVSRGHAAGSSTRSKGGAPRRGRWLFWFVVLIPCLSVSRCPGQRLIRRSHGPSLRRRGVRPLMRKRIRFPGALSRGMGGVFYFVGLGYLSLARMCTRRIQGRSESCQRGSRLPPGLRAWSLPQERNPPATQKIKFLGTVVTNLDPTSQNAR